MLDEYDSDPDSLPLDEPEPDELSRRFRFLDVRTRSWRVVAGGGETGFFRFNEIGEAAFFSIRRGRAVKQIA